MGGGLQHGRRLMTVRLRQRSFHREKGKVGGVAKSGLATIQYGAWAGVAGDGEAAAHSTIEEGEREIAIRYDTMFLN